MPTQYLTTSNTLTRKNARHEVGMLADQLTPGGTLTDAFGRLRISTPYTLFDSQHRYVDNGKWSIYASNGATATHATNESAINLTVTSTPSSRVIRESTRVMPYQPGKSLLIMSSFAMAPTSGLRQRVGYFNESNGIFFENDNGTNKIVLRSASLNTTYSISQSSWNGDKFDGTGYSGRTLDPTKTQIFWIDIEWLGVGDVRCGFIVDGSPVVAHTFHNDNIHSTAYMTTACLPLRYEIENLSSLAGRTMKQICSTVISEGGYEQITKQWAATRTSPLTVDSSTWKPVVSIQLYSTRLDSIVVPSQVHIAGTGNNAIYEFALIRNATITGGEWIQHTASGGGVEYNVTATGMANGTIEDSGIFASSNQSNALINAELAHRLDNQLGRSLASASTYASDTYTLAARQLAVGGTVYGTLNWNTIV